jgi:alkylated DNA nucleotide flippase Atl1
VREDFVEAVLEIVELIPAGRAVSYGDISDLLGAGGPRLVGTVLARHGSSVAWWRVLRASGLAPDGHEAEALIHYQAEGTALRGNSSWRVDLARARWRPTEADFRRIDELAGALKTPVTAKVHKMSEPDDEVGA